MNTPSKLRKYCLYANGGAEWIDIVRIYAVGCDGHMLYVVRHMEEGDDLYAFESISEALEFIKREFLDDKLFLKVGECP
jgi:hypothetical protein